jgi:trimethylamine--corrinoid protein Co-methyltransferase
MLYPVKLLSDDQLSMVHEASLEILQEVGLEIKHEKAINYYMKQGCKYNIKENRITISASIVKKYIKKFKNSFTFYGRNPELDKKIPDDSPVFVTASSAPDVIDPVTGLKRPADSHDIARIAHLTNQLKGYDIFSISTPANDAPEGTQNLWRYYPALKNCEKPVRGSGITAQDADTIFTLCSIIAGSREAFLERPFLTISICPVISPLKFDTTSVDQLVFFTERNIPNFSTFSPNAGVTSPLSLIGTLALCNAEFLAASILTQIIRPGMPLIFSALPTVADLRTLAYTSGAIETCMLLIGCTQMAQLYKVPSGGYIGLTNSKVCDVQAGFEKGMSALGTVLAGMDMIQIGGLIDAMMVFDYGMLVIDSEIAQMIKCVVGGFEKEREDLMLGLIREVGPGGTFIDKSHTLEHMRTVPFIPDVADRDRRQIWEKKGSPNAYNHALNKVKEILLTNNPAVFSEELDRKIHRQFKGLVIGDSKPLPGL